MKQQYLCSDLPNTLMSKNWIPIANDFSSEGTDLRRKRNGKHQYLNFLTVNCSGQHFKNSLECRKKNTIVYI